MPRTPKTLHVRAREGIKVPREGAPRRYITDQEAVQVRRTPYYRRQLRDGDLVEVKAPAKKSKPKKD